MQDFAPNLLVDVLMYVFSVLKYHELIDEERGVPAKQENTLKYIQASSSRKMTTIGVNAGMQKF